MSDDATQGDLASTKVGSLDLSVRGDRAELERALKRTWALPEEFFTRAPAILWKLVEQLDGDDTGKDQSRNITRIIKLAHDLEQANYTKARDAEDRKRLDDGDSTENITIKVVRTNQIDKPDD